MNATRTRNTSSKKTSAKGGRSRASEGGTGARKGAKSAQARKGAAKRGTTSTAKAAPKGAARRGAKAAAGGRKSAAKRSAGAGGSRSRTPIGQAIELLMADHKEVQKLFRQGERAKDDKQQLREIVEACCVALALHAEIEEQYFYPVMREAGGRDAGDMIAEAEVEHASAKQLIAQLQGGDADDEQYAATFKVLGEYVKHHVKEEENEIFPKARRARGDFEPLLEALMARDAAMEGGAMQQGQGGRSAGAGGAESSGNGGGRDAGATARNATRGRGGRSRSSGEGGGEEMQPSGGEGSMSSAGESSRRGRRGAQADTEDVETMSRGREDDEESTRGSRQGGR